MGKIQIHSATKTFRLAVYSVLQTKNRHQSKMVAINEGFTKNGTNEKFRLFFCFSCWNIDNFLPIKYSTLDIHPTNPLNHPLFRNSFHRCRTKEEKNCIYYRYKTINKIVWPDRKVFRQSFSICFTLFERWVRMLRDGVHSFLCCCFFFNSQISLSLLLSCKIENGNKWFT